MNSKSQTGSVLTVILLAVISLALLGSLIFGGWAYGERSTYKEKSDQKSAQAVASAEAEQKAKLAKEFAEQEKNPLKSYTGPETYGSVSFSYPKTWSAYIDESGKGSSSLFGYIHPNFVPNLTDTSFALRFEIVNTSYDQVVKSFDSSVKSGKVTAVAYVPKKLEGNKAVQPGLRFDGEIITKKQGSMVVIKLRDKTLKVWTESNDFKTDFDSIILPSLTFIP